MQKSYFDVLGICCSSEIPLIERILKPLNGVQKVSVSVPSKTVIVVHDNHLISQIQIVKALNQARLEANIRVFGEEKQGKFLPSPYTVASGVLLLLSFFKYFYHPLNWFALGAVAVGLPPIVLRSVAAIRSFTLDINILMLIAVSGTIALKDYQEAGTIVFLFTLAEWLESRASYKARIVMSSLMSMAPQKAVLAESGLSVDTKDVKIGTVLAVKAGEVIPIDGVVVEGRSEVDEKTLTGESFPVEKHALSEVWAGTMNLNGYISVQTTALAEDSAVARMAKLVEEAQHNRSKTQRFIDMSAKYYTPMVVLISAAFAVVPAALRAANMRHWFHLALVLLVSACPCALVLSTPVATFCALSKAATIGILIKGGDYLETLAKIQVMAFDKTGTITRGEFTVTDFRSIDPNISLNTLLYWVSSIESRSSHPMAATLVDYSRSNSIEPKPEKVEDFQIFPGEGIFGKIEGKNIHIGNRRIASRAGFGTDIESKNERGATIGYIFMGEHLVGIFSLSDTCRSSAASAIGELKSMGIKVAMLTGDSHAAATHIQEQLGHAIDLVRAELLPEDKVKIVNELKLTEGSTAMVGDGMNDAPALATADVGISMSISASAVASESAHVTLMSNDVGKITEAVKLSRRTRRKIIENVTLSIVTKAAILALAFSGHPLLWAAVLADVGTCLLVILNSMLLLRGATRVTKSCKSPHSSHAHEHHDYGACASSATHGRCKSSHAPHTHKHKHRMCGSANGLHTNLNHNSGKCTTSATCGHSGQSHRVRKPCWHAYALRTRERKQDGTHTSAVLCDGNHVNLCCPHSAGGTDAHDSKDEGKWLPAILHDHSGPSKHKRHASNALCNHSKACHVHARENKGGGMSDPCTCMGPTIAKDDVVKHSMTCHTYKASSVVLGDGDSNSNSVAITCEPSQSCNCPEPITHVCIEPVHTCNCPTSNMHTEHAGCEGDVIVTCEPIHPCKHTDSTTKTGVAHTHITCSDKGGFGMQANDIHVAPHTCKSGLGNGSNS